MNDSDPDTNFICEWSVTASSPEHTQESISKTSHDLGQPEFLKATITHLWTPSTNPTQDSHNLSTTDNYKLKRSYAQP